MIRKKYVIEMGMIRLQILQSERVNDVLSPIVLLYENFEKPLKSHRKY